MPLTDIKIIKKAKNKRVESRNEIYNLDLYLKLLPVSLLQNVLIEIVLKAKTIIIKLITLIFEK